eukprot:TRINITY_DN94222_c0_g1_i1.p1 TRINITY_DN94222_c0_g1~~TRINITY_DN94222_c0_g1_i1.p1  ORF type:complete len:201 (-),score=7.91 TRINITY_DN94222_c0_g1_i1:351-926(-)
MEFTDYEKILSLLFQLLVNIFSRKVIMLDIHFSFRNCQQKDKQSYNLDGGLSALQTIQSWSSNDQLSISTLRVQRCEDPSFLSCESPVAALVQAEDNWNKNALKRMNIQGSKTEHAHQNSLYFSNHTILIELGKCLARLGVAVDTAVAAGLLENFNIKQIEIVRRAHQIQLNSSKKQPILSREKEASLVHA